MNSISDFESDDQGLSPWGGTSLMLSVAQSVEHLIVVQKVAGSIPVNQPKRKCGCGRVDRHWSAKPVTLGQNQSATPK